MTKLRENMQFKGKNIVVLGIGLTGLSCVRFLAANDIICSVNDSRENPIDIDHFQQESPNVHVALGGWDQALIKQADLLIVSPGIDLSTPEIAEAISARCEVMGDVELYCRLSQTPMVAVTGSNGKSTVVSLIAHIGKSLGYKVALGGNIGIPVLDQINEPLDLMILELSSFQLETLTSMKALGACILNISDDHLDRHKTLENYANIKQGIYQQTQSVIYNRDDALTTPKDTLESSEVSVNSIGSDTPKQSEFGIATHNDSLHLMWGDTPLIAIHALPLAGIHNAVNCLAALAIGQTAGWDVQQMVTTLPSFKGLAHRCEKVSQLNDVIWVNDSKATNVGATLAAIDGLSSTLSRSQKIILIAGGEGKGADFSPLQASLKEHVDALITFGKDGDKIANLMGTSFKVNNLNEAVVKANQIAKPSDIVLLSPACASIDMFTNYMARGEAFVASIANLASSDDNAEVRI